MGRDPKKAKTASLHRALAPALASAKLAAKTFRGLALGKSSIRSLTARTPSLQRAEQEQADFFVSQQNASPTPFWKRYPPFGSPHTVNKSAAGQVRDYSTYSLPSATRAIVAPLLAPFHLLFCCCRLRFSREVGLDVRQRTYLLLPSLSLPLYIPTHAQTLPPPSSHSHYILLPISPPPRRFLGIVSPSSFRPSAPPLLAIISHLLHHRHAPSPSPLTPSSLQPSRRILPRSCDPSKGRTTSRIPRRTDHRPSSTHARDRAHAYTHRISSHSSARLREVKQQ